MTQEDLQSEGTRFDNALEAVEHYFERGWTDGLPVVPATADRVHEFLAAAGKAPGDVIGEVATRGRVITAEKVAVNAVMAGCRPEYMPVVVAVMEAMCEPQFNYHGSLASTGGSAQLIVVGGPIARELGVNGGVNLFGPGFRPNSTIGRAIRLIIMNVTGGSPGVMDKSTMGQGGKYSMCIAESLDHSPWEPLQVTRGFGLEENVVTVFAVHSPMQMIDHTSNTPEAFLENVAECMSVFGRNAGEFAIVVCPEHARLFRKAGWSKRQAAQYLHERARVSTAQLKRLARLPGSPGPGDDLEMHPCVTSAGGISLLVAGGEAGGFSSVISLWGNGHLSESTTRRIGGAA